jgi:AraC-like DNA-binding protein
MTIAFDCGFNTKSSFNAIFRKFEKVTPTEFRNGALENTVIPETKGLRNN